MPLIKRNQRCKAFHTNYHYSRLVPEWHAQLPLSQNELYQRVDWCRKKAVMMLVLHCTLTHYPTGLTYTQRKQKTFSLWTPNVLRLWPRIQDTPQVHIPILCKWKSNERQMMSSKRGNRWWPHSILKIKLKLFHLKLRKKQLYKVVW